MKPGSSSLRTLAVLAALPSSFLLAQSSPASNAAAPSSAEEETLVLSPFEVVAADDRGYVGQNTLAGSRLRTELKDVSAAISPMTAEFLSDIAATNLLEAVEYGMNARAETDDGRAAGSVNSDYNNEIRTIRIRGLPGGSRTVNYFRRLAEVDIYNTERLDVSRGPNSILYGFGSPAGLINASTKQARTDKEAYSLTFRVDSWDGVRTTLDANIPVIKNKLALRMVALNGRERSWRASGHNDQDRVFLTAKWKPDTKTTVSVDYETGRMDRFVPRPIYGIDLSSVWFAAGEPTFTNFNLSLPSTASAGLPGKPFRDSGTTQVNGVQEISGGDYVVYSSSFPTAQNYKSFTRSERPTVSGLADFPMALANPKAALEKNLWGGIWKDDSLSVTIQREIIKGMNFEAAVNEQTLDKNVWNGSWELQGIQGDPNLYLPNGQLKPVENKYYFEYRRSWTPVLDKIRQARATLSYEKDFGKFGRLRSAALGEWSTFKRRGQQLEEFWMNGADLTSGGAFNVTPENSANRVYHRHYITSLSQIYDPNFSIPAPYDLSGGVTYEDPLTKQKRVLMANRANIAQGNIDFYDEKLASYMLASQLYTLKDRVVLTGGIRKDELKHFEVQAVRDPVAEALKVGSGVWTPVEPGNNLESLNKGNTYSVGGVVHATKWLSLFANRSSSVNVPGFIRTFTEDPSLPNPSTGAPAREGETTDFGIKVSLLKDKLFLTATSYKTTAKRDIAFSGFQVASRSKTIWQAIVDSGLLTGTELTTAQSQLQNVGAVQGYLFDSDSKGFEFEAVGELAKGWSISVNFSKTESIRTNVAPRARAYVDYWKSTWMKYKDLQVAQNTSLPGAEYKPYQDYNTPEVIAATGDFTAGTTDSIGENIVDLEKAFFDNPYVYQGTRYIGDNKYNLNVRSKYDFSSGALKGFSIGAGARMRKGRVAGAKVDYTFKAGSSYTDAYNGREINKVELVDAVDQTIYDLQLSYRRSFKIGGKKLNWSVQLNVNNLLDEDALIVNNLQAVTMAPISYRYQDPRQFVLTNTFQF